MKNLTAFTILVLGIFILPSTRGQDLEEVNTEAYLSMMDADKLLEDGKEAEALGFYQRSLAAYQSLKKQDPEFKTQIVNYRIDLLSRKIASLNKQLPDSQVVEPPPEIDLAQEKDFKALYLQTREKMVQDSTRLLDLEKRNIQMTVTLRERQQEMTHMKSLLNDLERQLNAAKVEQTKATAALEKEVKDLSRFNNLLQDRADKIEMTSKQLETQRDELLVDGRELTDNLTALQEAHRNLEATLAETKRSATLSAQRMILERNQLEDDLNGKVLDLTNARKDLAEAQTKLKEMALLEETVIELNRRDEDQKTKISELQTSLNEMETRMAENQTVVEQAEATQAELQGRIDALQAEKDQWETKTETLNNTHALVEKQLSESDKKISSLEQELEKAKAETADAQTRTLDTRTALVASSEELRSLSQEQSKLQKEISALLKSEEDLKERNRVLEAGKQDQQKKLTQKESDMELLAQEVKKLRAGLSKETEKSEQQELRANKLDTRLKETEAEQNRLAINLKQESEQRKRLEKNAEMQLETITDRMNEIISLRQKISKLETDLQKEQASN